MGVNVNVEELVEFYEAGNGLIACQTKFGINKMTARRLLADRNVTIRGRGRPRKDTAAPTPTEPQGSSPSSDLNDQASDMNKPFSVINKSDSVRTF